MHHLKCIFQLEASVEKIVIDKSRTDSSILACR